MSNVTESLSYSAETLLHDLDQTVFGPAAPAEWLAALVARDPELAATATVGQSCDALVAAARAGGGGSPVSADDLAVRASRTAADRGAAVIGRSDLATAIAQLVQPQPPVQPIPLPRADTTRAAAPPPQLPQERVVRVFVSSTFRDMHAERDELVKRTFPQLRRLCEARGVTWGEVDLRWGITDEQKAEGKVLPICLREIRNCRPYFIGLLGERYGWVPDDLDAPLVEEHPWLADCRGISVTELEMRYGALNEPAMADHSFFYLRAPSYVDTVPDAERAPLVEDSADNRQRLAVLKDAIRSSGLPTRDYPTPETLGALVLADLTAAVERDFPEGSQPSWLDREAAEHRTFARSRTAVYVGRDAYYNRLDEHADGAGPPLVVLGDSGSGKSALLANWALRHQATDPRPHIVHFVGATPLSADWTVLLRRVIGELARSFDVRLDVPEAPEELPAAFRSALQMAAARGRVVLVLDALNQLEDRHGAPDLTWLPPELPAGIRLVVSTLPGRALDELTRRDWPTLRVKPLTQKERARLVADYLAPRTLAAKRVQRLAKARQTANPLFLRELLEELRVWGDHFRLDEIIDRCLDATTTKELFATVLARYQQDYERDRPGLVAEAMSLLWAARRGLSESELLDMLGTDGQPLPRAVWSPLFVAAEHSLVSRSGLLGFSHDYLRDAVAETYLASDDQQQAAHLRLADYFDSEPLSGRKTTELPWQLSRAQNWPRLYDVLADPDFLEAAWTDDRFDLKARWAELEGASSLRLAEAYQPVVDDPARYNVDVVWAVEQLLDDVGRTDPAMSLLTWQEKSARSQRDNRRLALALQRQGIILFERGDLDLALAKAKEHEMLARAAADDYGVRVSLTHQANVAFRRGELDAAMALHRQVEQLCRDSGDREGLQRCLGNQALILTERGELDDAIALHREEERICRELGDPEEAQTAQLNLGVALLERGDLDEAMALFEECERYRRTIGDHVGAAHAVLNQAAVRMRRGEVEASLAQLAQAETAARELGDRPALIVTLGGHGAMLREHSDLDGALSCFEEQAKLCRDVDDGVGLPRALGRKADVLLARGDVDRALEVYREQEQLARDAGDPDQTADALNNEAVALKRKGDHGAALTLLKEVESIRRARGDERGLATALINQGLNVMHQNDTDTAMSLLKEAEKIGREVGDAESVGRTLVNEAAVHWAANRKAQARAVLREARAWAAEHDLDELVRTIDAERDKVGLDESDDGSAGDTEPPPGLSAPTRLDIALRNAAGEVVLGIIATGDWSSDARLLPALRAKLQAHVEFARSRECVEKCGRPAQRILLLTTYPLTPAVKELLREITAASGLPIDVDRAPDKPDLLHATRR